MMGTVLKRIDKSLAEQIDNCARKNGLPLTIASRELAKALQGLKGKDIRRKLEF